MAAIVPDELLRSTTRWATAFVAGSVATIPIPILTLTHEVAQTMILDNLKALAALVILGVAASGAGVALSRPAGTEPPAKPDAPPVNAAAALTQSLAWAQLPMAMLRQKPPAEYHVDAGDVLAIFVDGVLGDRNQIPPIINLGTPQGGVQPPAIGYPMLVQDDGSISLPLLDPISVRDKSVGEIRQLIGKVYQDKGVIAPGARIFTSIAKPRTHPHHGGPRTGGPTKRHSGPGLAGIRK